MILDHELVFFFGDLNYRINLPNDYVRELVEQEVAKLIIKFR